MRLYARQFILKSVQLHLKQAHMPKYKIMSELFSQDIEKGAYIQQMLAPSSSNEST